MNFIIVDLVLLVIFVAFVSIFLYKKRRNLGKEGALFLYRTKWGIKLINKIGTKYKKTLHSLSYVSIGLGYLLMVSMFYLIIQTVYLYLTSPLVQIIKAPPVAPLIPYFPKLFGLTSYFPPFYFVYFIVAVLIVATVHEFSHGIFARRYDIKIRSTGFAFFKYFPAVLGAFVEQDETDMKKTKKIPQMGVLSAGVFANTLTAIFFYIVLFIFFSLTFVASGVSYNYYAYAPVNVSEITSVNGIPLENPSYDKIIELTNEGGLNEITTSDESFLTTKEFLSEQEKNSGFVVLYYDSPAIKEEISPVIGKINGVTIKDIDVLREELEKYSPGDKIMITSLTDEQFVEKEITLGENPGKEGAAWLGIGFINSEGRGIAGKIIKIVPSYKKEYVYYEAKTDFYLFIKDLLWWIVLINILVALFNMLPVGFLDGGRFFYLTIWGLTKSENKARKSFAIATYFLLFLLILLMLKWIFSFF